MCGCMHACILASRVKHCMVLCVCVFGCVMREWARDYVLSTGFALAFFKIPSCALLPDCVMCVICAFICVYVGWSRACVHLFVHFFCVQSLISFLLLLCVVFCVFAYWGEWPHACLCIFVQLTHSNFANFSLNECRYLLCDVQLCVCSFLGVLWGNGRVCARVCAFLCN